MQKKKRKSTLTVLQKFKPKDFLYLFLFIFAVINQLHAQTPFTCNGSAYLVSASNGNAASIITLISPSNPSAALGTITPNLAGNFNAMGYNLRTNLLYALTVNDRGIPGLTQDAIVTIDASGVVTNLGVPSPAPGETDLPAFTTSGPNAVGAATGTIDSENEIHYFFADGLSGRVLVAVDLNTLTYTTRSMSGGGVNDFAFSSQDGKLYGFKNDVRSFDPITGIGSTINTYASGSDASPGGSAGGAWADEQGRIYFYQNGSGGGELIRYTPNSNLLEVLGSVTGYGSFDADACYPPSILKKIIATTPIKPGDIVTFEFSIINPLPFPVTVGFSDILTSPNLDFIPSSLSSNTGGGTVNTNDGRELDISNITVPAAGLIFTINAQISSSATASPVTNVASITFGTQTFTSDDPDTSDIGDGTTFNIIAPVDLVISKIVDDTTPAENDKINYTITIVNNGPLDATNVSLDDILPPGVTATGTNTASQGTFTAPTWNVGDIMNGDSANLIIQATVNTGTLGTTINNTITNIIFNETDTDDTTDDLEEAVTITTPLPPTVEITEDTNNDGLISED
ncbi:DUF6923 family protein, partial [Cellulophaga fucicola]|uniref:DUF6923 family protein n=1 Tax=Cellulophaga fucicola TaxID=76595 RepID=UPI003EBB319B